MRLLTFASALASLLLLTACGDSAMEAMPDKELAKRYGQCLDKEPSSPGYATSCENMRKECERRERELSKFICRKY